MVRVHVRDASKAKQDALCEKRRVCMVTATSAPQARNVHSPGGQNRQGWCARSDRYLACGMGLSQQVEYHVGVRAQEMDSRGEMATRHAAIGLAERPSQGREARAWPIFPSPKWRRLRGVLAHRGHSLSRLLTPSHQAKDDRVEINR